MSTMLRSVATHLELGLSGTSKLIFSVAAAKGSPVRSENLTITVDGATVEPQEVVDVHGSRLHTLAATGSQLVLDYQAEIDGITDPPVVAEIDEIVYARPSRYCESDSLAPTAASQFGGLTNQNLLRAVISWVNEQLAYVAGSSLPTDGAVRTLLARQGVCRDFAHLSIALLRALNVPARLAAVYAPGLSPMEYHAVAEAFVDDAWWVVDATQLAPRQSLLRISTGRDAADTAFLTNFGAPTTLNNLQVTAVVDNFELDNPALLTQLR